MEITALNDSRIFANTNPNAILSINKLTLSDGQTTSGLNEPNCSVLDGRGGAICSMGELQLNKVTIINSETQSSNSPGGAIFANQSISVSNSLLFDNITNNVYSHGGAIYAKGQTVIDNSYFGFNKTQTFALSSGGAVYIASLESATITNSTFAHNSTNQPYSAGGAINLTNGIIRNSTFYDNDTISSHGSAIYSNSGQLIVSNSTITGNSGPSALALLSQGILTVTDSIVTANGSGGSHYDIYLSNGQQTLNVTYSLIGNYTFINGYNSSNITTFLPDLSPLTDNGCHITIGSPLNNSCVWTLEPNQQSQARNNGSPSISFNNDQRGGCHPRVAEGAQDIGAFETAIETELVFCGKFD